MEGLSINAYKGIRGYWKKRRHYERLNGAEAAPGSPSCGGGRRRRRRRWRIKISRRIRVGSPRKWLTRLRDAYVKMMLRFANSAIMSGGGVGYGGAAVEYGGFAVRKEYDEKVLVEIYKSVLRAQGSTVHRDAAKPSAQKQQVVC